MSKNKNLIAFFLCFLITVSLAFGATSQEITYKSAITTARSEIWQAINTGKCASATVAIMVDGKVVYSEGFAMADRAESVPIDKNTIFNIGSISKVFTAAAIMLLVDDGKVSLDKPVTAYLPEFKMADNRYKNITVRMTLNHSSGIPGTEGANTFGFAFYDKVLKDTINTLSFSHLKHNPGEMAVYCNDGFSLAEMIIERVSGKKYIDFLNERVFTPLNLKNTGLSVGEVNDKTKAVYYEAESAKIEPFEVVSLLGAGGLSSTAEDLCLFADTFSEQNKIFSEKSLNEMKKPQPSAFWGKLRHPEFSFGLGWDLTFLPRYESAGIQIFGKSGGTGNYSSMLFTVPEKRISVAVIASGADSGAFKIALDIIDAVLVEKGLIQKEKKVVSMPKESEKIPQEFALFNGYYSNGSQLGQIEFDMNKNTVTLYSLKGTEKTPKLSFIYNNNYFYDDKGDQFYFTSINGEDYLAGYSTTLKIDFIVMQKVKLIEKPMTLKINLDNKQWLRRNVYPFEGVMGGPSHCVKSLLYKDLPGYVSFNGVKKIETPEYAGMPFCSMRDQTELTLFEKDGETWARVSDMIYSPAESAGLLKIGENSVKISDKGYSEWLKTDEDMILSFTSQPQDGRIIVFSPDNAEIIYDNVINPGDVFVKKGSFVEFAGLSNDTFLVCGRK